MRPHTLTRHTALRLMFGTALTTLFLPGCTEVFPPLNEKTSAPSLSGEWVNTQQLFKRPKDFVNRGRLRFYMARVDGRPVPVNDLPDHLSMRTSDRRIDPASYALSVFLMPPAKKTWESAQLEKNYEYGITLTGHVRPLAGPGNEWFVFMADGVEINDETYYLDDPRSRLPDHDYRPTQVLELPRPLTVTDGKRLSLLANDYVGRKVRFDLNFSVDDLRVSKSGSAFMATEYLSLQLDETLVRSLLEQKQAFLSHAHVIGKVLNERDEAGRLKIQVFNLEQRSW